MKILTVLLSLLLVTGTSLRAASKDPIVIEVITRYKSVDEALQATKRILLAEKFITPEVQKKSFTATRTTGAKADYYVADVLASEAGGAIKITVTFVKVGTGLLKLQKVADTVKAELEK